MVSKRLVLLPRSVLRRSHEQERKNPTERRQVVSEVPKATEPAAAAEEEEVSPRGHTMLQQQFVYDHAIFDLSRSRDGRTFHAVFGGTRTLYYVCRWVLAGSFPFLAKRDTRQMVYT